MTVPMKNVNSTPVYCEPHDFNQLPYSNMEDPEYAVPDLFGNNKVTFLNLNGNKANNTMLGVKSFMTMQTPNVITFINGNNQKTPHCDEDDDGKARYYASTDVLARSNLPFENSNHVYNLENLGKGAEYFFNTKANGILSDTPPPPPLMNLKNNSLSPPSSISSNSSRGKGHSSNGHSESFDSYENTQLNTVSTKTPSPVITHNLRIPQLKDNEISVINGQFGYSKYGDCELGYILRNNEKKLVILRTLFRNAQFREEFLAEMNVKWCLSSKCTESFATFFGYVSKYEYLAMVIEYGDMDLKKFLRTSSPSTVGYVNEGNKFHLEIT